MAHDTHLASAVDAHEGLAGLRRAHESAVRSAEMDVVAAVEVWRAAWRPEAVTQSPEWWASVGQLATVADVLYLAHREAAAAGVSA